jgi:tetratricopeptide (TPR) repeat protein
MEYPLRMPAWSTRRTPIPVGLVLAVWTFLVFRPSLNGEYLRYDEEAYVTKNPVVQQGLTPEGTAWAFGLEKETIYWHPLTWLSHMADVELFGLDPRGHHAGSVLLHVLCTLLLFLVLLRMTGGLWPSAFVAALFALHPLHVESVAWIAERKDVLSAFFWMLTLGAYALYAERPGPGRYLAVVVCFVLGLMAKPMVVTLPFVLLLVDWWPLRRFSRATAGRRVLEKLPLLGMAAFSSGLTYLVQKNIGALGEPEALPLGIRLGNALASYGGYIGQMFWPLRLATFYPHSGADLEAGRVLAGAAVVAGMSALVIWQRRRRYLTVGWLWYLGTLVPVIGLVQAGDQAMADRFTYIPLIGLFVMLAWGIAGLPGLQAPDRTRKLLLGVPAGGVLLGLTVLTVIQIGTWRDSISLWRRALAVTDKNYFAHNNLGQAYNDAGRYEEAAEQYAAGVALAPEWAEGHSNLGNVLVRLGRIDGALKELRIALELKYAQTEGRGDPVTGEIHLGMGLALAEANRVSEAREQFEKAIALKPDHAPAHYALGRLLLYIRDYSFAVGEFREAARLAPGMIAAHTNLAAALYLNGDHAGAWEAVAACRALGYEVDAAFLEALSDSMAEP